MPCLEHREAVSRWRRSSPATAAGEFRLPPRGIVYLAEGPVAPQGVNDAILIARLVGVNATSGALPYSAGPSPVTRVAIRGVGTRARFRTAPLFRAVTRSAP